MIVGRIRGLLFVSILALSGGTLAHAGTITGQIQTASSGRGVANGVFTFTLSQPAVVSGSASIVTSPVNCYTDAFGNVVGLPNPLTAPAASSSAGSGLPAAAYRVRYTWANSSGETVAGPALVITTTLTGSLTVQVPPNPPAGASVWNIYIGTSAVAETLQATQIAPFTNYTTSSSSLLAGAALPAANTSACSLRFNDELQPSYTGYNVTLTTSGGAAIPGFPQKWYLSGGSSGTINVGSGLPLYNGVVSYPQPIISNPAQSGTQSIGGPLSLGTFGLTAGTGGFFAPSTPQSPALQIGAPNTGILNASNGLEFSIQGTDGLFISTLDNVFINNNLFFTLNSGEIVLGTNNDTGISRGTSGQVNIGNGNSGDASGVLKTGQIQSTAATGTPPLTVSSTTSVANLNPEWPRMQVGGFGPSTFVNSGVMAPVFTRAVTVTRVSGLVETAPIGCTVAATITIDGFGAAASIANGNFLFDSGPMSLNVGAGGNIIVRTSPGTGCSTQAANATIAVEYKMQ